MNVKILILYVYNKQNGLTWITNPLQIYFNQIFATPWTVAHQDPLFMNSPGKNEYRSELPFPSPGDLPDSGTEPGSPAL